MLYFPSEGRRAEDFFFALKNPTASVGFEPANLGTKGQHATSRPPKPLTVCDTSMILSLVVSQRWVSVSVEWELTGQAVTYIILTANEIICELIG